MNNIKKSIIVLTLLICLLFLSANILILAINIIPYSITKTNTSNICREYYATKNYDAREDDDVPVTSTPTDSAPDIGFAPRPEITEKDKIIVTIIGISTLVINIAICSLPIIILFLFLITIIFVITIILIIVKKKKRK